MNATSGFENIVCSMTYNTQTMNTQNSTKSTNVISTYSCGKKLFYTINPSTAKYSSITGEDLTCDNPWMSAPDFTAFIIDADPLVVNGPDKNYAVCSYFRYFAV